MINEMRSRQDILTLAHQHGLTLQADSLQFNESGLDFQVVFATDAKGDRWVLRLPRREDVLPSVEQEKRTLELVVPLLAVEAPQWTVCTDELIAYRALSGTPAGTIDVDAKAYLWSIDITHLPDQFHESLARGMVSLHHIDCEQARAAGLPVATIDESRTAMQRRMDFVKREFGVSEALWHRWQSWLQKDEIWPQMTVLTHGDLHAGHILIDTQAQVTGLIDWTEAAVADPAVDFVAHFRTFGEAALEKLISAYDRMGGYTWSGMAEHVTELAAAYPVAIAEFALKSNLDEYKQMARQGLGVSEA